MVRDNQGVFLSSVSLNLISCVVVLCAFGGKQHGGYENNVTFGCRFHSWCLDPSEVGHADSCTQTQLPMILKTPQESIEKDIKQQQQQKKNPQN